MENSVSSSHAANAPASSPELKTPMRRSRGKLWDWKLTLASLGVALLLIVSLSVGEYSILSSEFGWEMFGITRIPRTIALVRGMRVIPNIRSEEHTSELQSRGHLVCRLLLEKKKKKKNNR